MVRLLSKLILWLALRESNEDKAAILSNVTGKLFPGTKALVVVGTQSQIEEISWMIDEVMSSQNEDDEFEPEEEERKAPKKPLLQ